MSKIRVPIAGTVGKSVQFDPNAGARAEAAVAALAAQISAGIGGTILHRNLRELQVGDDHPQYAGWQFPETIVGQWNFQTIPLIQGETLAEYIEDVVGGDFFDFLQDTSSVVWTYHETANELEANVPPEFVQDTVGAMLLDTSSIDLTYNDVTGQFSAAIIDEYVQDLVGAMATDSTTIDFTYNDGAGTLSAAVISPLLLSNGSAGAPSHSFSSDPNNGLYLFGTDIPAISSAGIAALRVDATTGGVTRAVIRGQNTGNANVCYISFEDSAGTEVAYFGDQQAGTGSMYAVATLGALQLGAGGSVHLLLTTAGNVRVEGDNKELQIGASQDFRLYHNGTDSIIENDTGNLILRVGGELSVDEVSTATTATGGARTLPANPVDFLVVIINGTSRKIPYYAT